jgi:RNA recognition motif-containing protein
MPIIGGGAKGPAKTASKDNKLNDIDPSLKVWIGGLPEGVDQATLQSHFETVGPCQSAEILPRGVACVAYSTAEEAQTAIASLNDSQLGGKAIKVDTWEKKPENSKTGKGKGKGKSGGWGVWQPNFSSKGEMMMAVLGMMKGKGKDAGKGKGKGWSNRGSDKINKIDADKKVWVGNVAESVKWKELEEHFKQVGATTWAEKLPKGVACVAFKTAEEAAAAISLSGSELGGQAIEVDVWTEKPKKSA